MTSEHTRGWPGWFIGGSFFGTLCLTGLNWHWYGRTNVNLAVLLCTALGAFGVAILTGRMLRAVQGDTPRFYSYVFLVLAAAFFAFRLLLLLVKSDKFKDVLLNSIDNILDNLFACAVCAYIGLRYGGTIYAWYKKDKRVLSRHFSTLDECLLNVSQAIEMYKVPQEAYVVFVAPFLFTERYVKYALADKEERAVHHCLKLLQDFRLSYNQIVKAGGRGAYDKTLIGRTGVADIDRATYEALKESHGFGSEMPGTCELGYHTNLNEFLILILGRADPLTPSNAAEYIFMLQIYFSSDFKTMSGFIFYDHKVIESTEIVLKRKMDEARENPNVGNYVVNEDQNAKPVRDWPKLTQELKQFLSGT